MELCPERRRCAAADSSAARAAAQQQLAERLPWVGQSEAAGLQPEPSSKRQRQRLRLGQRVRWFLVLDPKLMAEAVLPGTALQKSASGRSELRRLGRPEPEAAAHSRLSYSVSSGSDQPRERPESEKDRSWHPEYFLRRAFCIRPRPGQNLHVRRVAAPDWPAAGSARHEAIAARDSRVLEASDARALAALPQWRNWPGSEPR